MFKRRGNNRRASDQLKFLRSIPRMTKDTDNSDLSNFDACIEACDSLAASPASAEFQDCSVLVSPDGMLLDSRRSEGGSYHENAGSSDDENVDSFSDEQKGSVDVNIKTEKIMYEGKLDEYDDAVFIGNDMSLSGDKDLNGFSVRGLNPVLSSLALKTAVGTIEATGHFVEELILSRKNAAASASQACEKLRDMMHIDGAEHLSIDLSDGPNPMDGMPRGGSLSLTPGQKSSAGPLLFPGSSLRKAVIALDKYHSSVAEADAHRWRMATKTNNEHVHGVLPEIERGVQKSKERIERRDRAMMSSQEGQAEAESNLRSKKERSKKLWQKVDNMENEVQRKIAELVRQRNRERELRRREEETHRDASFSNANVKLETGVTNQEIWELVARVGEEGEDFAPSGLPTPAFHGPIDQTLSSSKSFDRDVPEPQQAAEMVAEIDDCRAALEAEFGLDQLRKAALECDEQIQDAAGSLLNVYSSADTTKRSAKVAAETVLLSSANTQLKCLRSLVELEKASINERLRLIEELEKAVNSVDVRPDLNAFIEHEKTEIPNGTSKSGDNDDGGVASALAVLNSHSEGIGVGIGVAGMAELSSFSGWNENEEGEVFDREELEDAVNTLFGAKTDDAEEKERFDKSVELLTRAVGEKSVKARGYRASSCYAMNNHRGKVTQLQNEQQLNGLCKVLNSLLDGCDRESADVASAKMVMMLAQTFYIVEGGVKSEDRTKRIYPKDRLCAHRIWLDEDFWVQALFQCVTDSLSNSGVIMRVRVKKSETNKGNKMRWHDLRPIDRVDAAAQVHAVIFAQLGALSHSMVEFGCKVEKACHFVRRLSVRHQLPLAQRAMLLAHLRKSDKGEEDEDK